MEGVLKIDSKPITRIWAIALIVINLLRIGSAFIVYFQTQYQIVSPLIPQTAVLEIVGPYMTIGLVSLILTIVGFTFYVCSKFTFTIITCLVSLVFGEFYFVYLHFYS